MMKSSGNVERRKKKQQGRTSWKKGHVESDRRGKNKKEQNGRWLRGSIVWEKVPFSEEGERAFVAVKRQPRPECR